MSSAVKDLDEVLEEIPTGRYHYMVVCLAGMSYICDGIVANMIGFSSKCAGDEFSLTSNELSHVPMALFSGAIVGAIFLAQIADIFGRREALLLSIEIILAAFVFTGIFTSFGALITGWFLIGCGAGGTGIAFDYVAEVLPIKSRVVGFQLNTFWPVAALLVGSAAWIILGSGSSWRLLMFSMCVPVAIVWGLVYFHMPESARWYLNEKRYEEAEAVVRSYALINGTSLEPFSFARGGLLQNEHGVLARRNGSGSGDDGNDNNLGGDNNNGAAEEDLSNASKIDDKEEEDALMTQVCITTDKFGASLAEFWHKIKAIFGPKMIGVTFSMSYIFWTSALALYGSMLLQARMLKTEQADLGGCTFEFGQYLMSAPAELASALLVFFTTDLQGRRWNMFTWSLITSMFAFVLCFNLNTAASYTALLGLRFSAAGVNAASWIPATELYSTEYRATAFSLCYVMSRVGAIVAAVLVDSELTVKQISAIFSAFSFLSACVSLSVRETVGESVH